MWVVENNEILVTREEIRQKISLLTASLGKLLPYNSTRDQKLRYSRQPSRPLIPRTGWRQPYIILYFMILYQIFNRVSTDCMRPNETYILW